QGRGHAQRRPVAQRGACRDGQAARRLLDPHGHRDPDVDVKRRLARLSLPFREPFVTSAGVVPSRELLLLRIEDDDGAVGYGEAAPFEPYDGIPLEAVADALRRNGSADGDAPPQARAAAEMARL